MRSDAAQWKKDGYVKIKGGKGSHMKYRKGLEKALFKLLKENK